MGRDSGRDIPKLSKTQIDRLGDRLRKGDIGEVDLQLLDAYRRTYADAYDTVIRTIRSETGLEPTGRPAKSTTSISEKLRRESIRLTQIQDIAGCRLVVTDIVEQDRLVERLKQLFDKVDVVDRREHPSYGYRAVHVIITSGGKLIEVQVRTAIQHLWAELSEKLSDTLDPAIKYGGGDEVTRSRLSELSSILAAVELRELRILGLLESGSADKAILDDLKAKKAECHEEYRFLKRQLVEEFQKLITKISNHGEGENALSD